MNEIYVQMSQNLEKKLMTLKDTNEDVLFVIEKAIGLCTLVLHKMKELVSEKDFTDKASEIHFFKHIKPRVYAKLVFYLKLLKIETHRPLFPQENQIHYLVSIMKDLEKIYVEYTELYHYYRLNHTHLDEKYFLRNSMYVRLDSEHVHHLLDRKFSTAQDYIIALFIAHRHLITYIGDEIKNIEGDIRDSRGFEITHLKSCNFKWTDSKVAMVELIYALHSSRSINEGRFGIKEMARLFENIFDIELGDVYRIFLEVRSRKIERTKYIDYLKDSLIRKMDSTDNRDLEMNN
ncbi:hypothetical protein DF185_04065 [Marinifilum breve]|uniref:Tetracycline regulation of excision, RteC n=1 Tax=Marinifilum breve TaxID=2184082 RepID=A0A2V3ZZX3_9BACT|nr:RteC domain-containing protein [Marinifilum breve]PXY01833.1 hypothetical protein DF185_04065 [Marinifilum breve]